MVESTKKEENKQLPDDAESPSTKVKRNWADVEDDAEEDGAQKDIGGSGPVAKAPKAEEKPKIVPPKTKREKNAYGDFVVTTINVKVKEREEFKDVKPDDEESEEEEDSSEPEPDKEEEEEKSK